MLSLPRHMKKLVRRSTIVAPSKPLQGFFINVPSGIVRPGKSSWNTNSRTNHTTQVVTGLDLVPLYHGSDVNLQHPDYADERTRLQSFKHWCGIIPCSDRTRRCRVVHGSSRYGEVLLLSCSYTRLEERRSAH